MADIEWTNVEAPLKTRRLVTPSDDSDLPDGMCRCLIVSEDCVLNVIHGDRTQQNDCQFFKGYNPCLIRRVLEGADADAVTIEAGY